MSKSRSRTENGNENEPAAETKRVFVKSFGCQMNVYDSERMAEAMAAHGYAEQDEPDDADLIVLNTCHIREKAAEKVYSELGRLRSLKDGRQLAGKRTVIAVAGCVAQAEGKEIIARSPIVDVVVGPQAYHRLPDLVAKALSNGSQIIDTEFPEEEKFSRLPQRARPKTAAAFLTVQEGCDKFCTFCVVPYTRGMEFSRPVRFVEEEARRLIEGGVRELTLLGQNVNAYHGEGPDGQAWPLARLLAHLAKIDGLERLRYTTSHPRDMSDDLIAEHGANDKLMPYLHLPFQAGADRILAAMNRKHTAAEYRALVTKIRRARPDIALSTDIIVGFPGETEGEFQETLEMVSEVGFAQAYSFKYSPRHGTPAATIEAAIPEPVKTDRLHRLQQLLSSQQASFNTGCIGKIFPVLFEKLGRRAGQLVGRSPYLQPVHAQAEPSLLGQILPVEISGASAYSLAGVLR